MAVNQDLTGKAIVNTFYVHYSGTFTSAMVNSIGANVKAAYGNLLQSTDWTFGDVVCTDLSVEGGAQFVYSSHYDGADDNQPLPFQTAAGVTWLTGRIGKSYRGRSFLGGFCEDVSDGRDLSGPLQTVVASFADDLIAAPSGLGELVVVSRFHRNPDTTPGQPHSIPRTTNITTPINGYVVRPTWHTQRHRAAA